MKMSLFYMCLFSFFVAEVSGQISGKLATSAGEPIPSANALLLSYVDSSLVKAALTDEKGLYRINNVRPGKYLLQISSMGFQNWLSEAFEVTAIDLAKDFGTQVLKEEAKELGQVVVRAGKPLVQLQPYGTVINVENSLLTKGSSALEVLERSPGVYIDHQNNLLSLNGKSGVVVMINGKLIRMSIGQVVTMLRGISANDIEKIELLTTPPSKYDAEGSAGMINIVLKKNKKQGTGGSFSVTGGYGYREKGTGSLTLDHRKGEFGIYGSYTYSHDRSYMDWVSKAVNEVPLLGGLTSSEFSSVIKPLQKSHNATIGLDSRINKKWAFRSAVTYNRSKEVSTVQNRASYLVLPDSQYALSAVIMGVNRWRNVSTSVHLEKNISTEEQLSFDVDYLNYKNSNPTDVVSSFIDKNGDQVTTNDTLFSPRQVGFANTNIDIGVGKIDYTRPLSKGIKLEAGLKGTFTRNSSVSGIESLVNGTWVGRSETTNNMLMEEGIGALYTSVNSTLSPVTKLTVGARYEYSETRMNDEDKGQNIANRKLGKLFPGVFFSWKISDKSDFQLSYTKRISRPTYNDLASFIIYTSPTAVETGNPLLKPTITNNVNVGYSYQGYSFSVLLSRDNHPIVRYQISESPTGKLMSLSPQNLIYQNNLTFQTNLPWKVGNWWNMNYGFTGGWRRFKGDYTAKPFEKTYFGYSLNASETFKLPANYSIEVSGWYNSLAYDGSKKVNGFGALNGGIKKDLNKNWGTLQLAVTDIFKSVSIHSAYGTLTQEAFSLRSQVVFNTETAGARIVKLTYTKSFGNNSVISERKQGNGSQDERERVRN